VGKHFSLVDGLNSGDWPKLLEEALRPYGTLEVVSEAEAVDKMIDKNYEATILDCSSVKEAKLLIYRLLAQQPETRIVAVATAPTWELTRDVLQAGAIDCIRRLDNREDLQRTLNEILSRPATPPNWLRLAQDPSSQTIPILLADNQIEYLKTWQETLEHAGYIVLPATTSNEAKRILESGLVDFAIIDMRLEDDDSETDESGLTLATEVAPSISKIILTRHPDYELVKNAMAVSATGKRPAIDFIDKREARDVILTKVRLGVEIAQERRVLRAARWARRFPTIAILSLLVALAAGILAIVTGDARWLLATTMLVIFVVLFVGLSAK
jgi:DNA-binding NtrC family response regulator